MITNLNSLPQLYYVTKTKSFNVSYTIMNQDGTTSTKTATCESFDNGNG